MSQIPRKRSPRAPSIALDEAIDKAIRIYDRERRHPAPTDVVAQNLGYKNANNGAALSSLASLRYYGLLERPVDGQLAVTKEVEDYKFSPSAQVRQRLLARWLKGPQVFSDLLDKYGAGLPSDATLKYDLIQRGFGPPTAELTVGVFKRSVEFSEYFNGLGVEAATEGEDFANSAQESGQIAVAEDRDVPPVQVPHVKNEPGNEAPVPDLDRIPVRLSGNRRAWLLIPTPFFDADKARLKAQIDLLLADDESSSN